MFGNALLDGTCHQKASALLAPVFWAMVRARVNVVDRAEQLGRDLNSTQRRVMRLLDISMGRHGHVAGLRYMIEAFVFIVCEVFYVVWYV